MKRKEFIKSTVAASIGFAILPRHVLGGNGFLAPSDRINLGFIGVGKQAAGLASAMNELKETMIVAASDVDSRKLSAFIKRTSEMTAAKPANNVRGYAEYRELLAAKDIDAIVVASPDHWHAMHVIDSAKAGKDIYCEKPLSLTIGEGRAMVDAVKKYKRVLQTGSMQRSMPTFRQAVNLIRNGYIGEVREVNVSVGEPVKQCDLPSMPIPDYLDWDNWIGPSLYRGYHPILSPPIEDNSWAWWRGYRGFGGGYITDWGAHMFDIVQWALDMDGAGPISFTPPPQAGDVEGLFFDYANGVRVYHKHWGKENAIQFLGTEGSIEVSRGFIETTPKPLANHVFSAKDKLVYHADNHHQDWLDAIKGRKTPIAPVEVGHRTATICNAVNIAYELQRPLKWNPKKEKFDDLFANQMIHKPYRGKWNYLDF
ncbi:Gfo/Idh/MocA family oxidoreductase [Sphingobacterium sp. UT-1RO-CII-1]|uniref:Gfo/Idh/MocA family protein n=1 Tax=Sphingobacterium sp. UT-1RO-CII-1 TaxID=2995225 RepID=UPI00227CEDE5|nr:Gfo/Idh/MocA family oxidoreductase [Sphingobacterium sp. UT-1RO-CII-1]MCY4779816.1 Gfo/Idh/MocA family oxidoreductase [Sphingobacterium sp. UT-1RO-CII-1]